jgi:putative ABC transport system ATP-binding protein
MTTTHASSTTTMAARATPRGGPAVVLEDVSKRYGTGEVAVDALRGISASVDPGELVVVLGPSGSGKTTLLNLIGGIEPPTSGRLTVNGVTLHDKSPVALTEYRRGTIGFVFQFFNLIPTLTALENVQLVAELAGSEGAARSEEWLTTVGLTERLDHFPGSLSGGEQQRVAIARALVNEAPVLLCDEPTGSLDVDSGRGVLSQIRHAADSGRTVVLVTHNSAIARIGDRVLRMGSGRIVEDRRAERPDPPEEISW